ncbi:MAG: carboxymuconolactone decarboxylase family protein [Cyclobacteriaceae bacterium]
MSVVKTLERGNIDPSLNEIYDNAENHFGRVPNLVKAMANNPTMCTSITNFLIQSLGKGRIDWGFKELVILKTLRAMKSFYSYGAHELLASQLGVSDEKIGDIANSLWKESAHFSEAEKVVFELTDQIAVDANDVSDELWDRLRGHWDNGQLLEINAVITTFLMIGRVGDALGVSDPVLFTKPISDN